MENPYWIHFGAGNIFRAFQGALENGGNGVMLAYTRWGTKWSGAVEGLKHILRNEWDNNGLNITGNVLTAYVNPADGMFGITTTCDSMMHLCQSVY